MTDGNYEPRAYMSSHSLSASPPSCLKWARTLTSLLEDREGVELFKKYVESEGGIHCDRLNFYFACEGLKQQSDPEKVKQIIGAIYRFLRKSELNVPEDIKRTVKGGLKDEFILTPDLYDQMQQDVERIINETTYPNFLQSDMYVKHVSEVQNALEKGITVKPDLITNAVVTTNTTATTSTITSEGSSKFLSRSSTLPTLHEESELLSAEQDFSGGAASVVSSNGSKLPLSLTRDALMATQRRRLEMRPPG